MINYLLPLILIICQFVLFILKKSKIVMILIPILLSIIAVIIAVYIDQVLQFMYIFFYRYGFVLYAQLCQLYYSYPD